MTDEKMIIVDFPLRGEWIAPHTPGDRVPSHGTDILGQRFAYDFIMTKRGSKTKLADSSIWKHATLGISLDKCYGYKEKIYSPVDGTVIVAKDGVKEPKRLHLIIDLVKVLWNSISVTIQSLFRPINQINPQKFTGNYVIIEFNKKYAFFAHISPDSIVVKEGQTIKKGDLIGLVGHSGNSTAPHLHFHLIDFPDLWDAQGIPCAFKKYDINTNEEWKSVENNVPKSNQRIKY